MSTLAAPQSKRNSTKIPVSSNLKPEGADPTSQIALSASTSVSVTARQRKKNQDEVCGKKDNEKHPAFYRLSHRLLLILPAPL